MDERVEGRNRMARRSQAHPPWRAGGAGHKRTTGTFEKQQQPFVDLEWEGQSLGDRVTAQGCPQLVAREPCFLIKALGRLFT